MLARRGNPGLAALLAVAGVERPPGAYHLGFVLGPRINAGGRIGEAGLGARLLASDDADEARRIAELQVAGTLRADDWRGNGAVQLVVSDAAPAGSVH